MKWRHEVRSAQRQSLAAQKSGWLNFSRTSQLTTISILNMNFNVTVSHNRQKQMRMQSWKQATHSKKPGKGFSKGVKAGLWFTAWGEDLDSQVTEGGGREGRRRWAEGGRERDRDRASLTEVPRDLCWPNKTGAGSWRRWRLKFFPKPRREYSLRSLKRAHRIEEVEFFWKNLKWIYI